MDDVKLTENALKVLESRYLLRDEKGKVVESPSRLFKRVSSFVARAEKRYRSRYTPDEVEEHFYGMMEALEFLPNSPTLMNAGTPLGQLAACFVLQ
jgi:ribonucleoside-diphosphate reductase alpha chain